MYEKFHQLGLSEELLDTLSDMGFEEPTEIQEIAIPSILKGRDIIGIAQTGTGKTAAFGIPIVENFAKGRKKRPGAIVLVPTRELAMQVAQELNRIGRRKGIVSVPIYGGQSIERQIKSLHKGIDIVVGTPGRIIDHIMRKTLILDEVVTAVLDEADEMLNMGFIEDMRLILEETPTQRQTLLFSATIPEQIVRISRRYMTDPERVSVDATSIVVTEIKQIFYEVREADKIKALTRILDVQDPALTLIFCHTKREVDELSAKLQQMGYDAGAIHGDFTQSFRDEMMGKFKKGDLDILVATDVAARGLDINNVTHVINYSIPQNPEAYIHRIGRTGRAGKSGIAITFVTPREYKQLKLIERIAKTTIRKEKLPTKAEVRRARETELTENIETVIGEGNHKDYLHLAQELSHKYSSEQITAAALSLIAGDLEVESIDEFSEELSRSGSGMVRLFLTIGRKDRIKVGDIVRTISEKTNVPGRKIGKIALFDKYSFVEVPESSVQQIIGSINDVMMGGRRIKVQPARQKRHSDGKSL